MNIEVVKDEQVPGLTRNTFWISRLLKSFWRKRTKYDKKLKLKIVIELIKAHFGTLWASDLKCFVSHPKLWFILKCWCKTLRFCTQNLSFYIESKVHLKTAPQPERVAPQLQKWGAVLHLGNFFWNFQDCLWVPRAWPK